MSFNERVQSFLTLFLAIYPLEKKPNHFKYRYKLHTTAKHLNKLCFRHVLRKNVFQLFLIHWKSCCVGIILKIDLYCEYIELYTEYFLQFFYFHLSQKKKNKFQKYSINCSFFQSQQIGFNEYEGDF